MSLVINTNLGAINGQKNLNSSSSSLATSMQRLSSGTRINSAKDDASGLAITDRMTSQIRGMSVAVRNAQDGISLTQVVEGSLVSLTDTLQRMRDLAVQSANNASVSASDRDKMQTEFKALNSELLRVIENSDFNGKKILNGGLASGLSIQVGANTNTNDRVMLKVPNMSNSLSSVIGASLSPKMVFSNSTFLTANIVTDSQLKNATEAATLANAAVEAAKLAANSPMDLALAKASSDANKKAAERVFASSEIIVSTTSALFGSKLVSNAFSESVTKEHSANSAVRDSVSRNDAAVQSSSTTNATQSNLLLSTAKQLADAAKTGVEFTGQNLYASTIYATTGDTLEIPDSRVTNTQSLLNNGQFLAGNDSYKSDRLAQKKLAASEIAKAIAEASYVNDPTETNVANEVGKQSFIKNNALVLQTSAATDAASADYALSAIDEIDRAISTVDNERTNVGTMQNRLNTTISNLQVGIENQSIARSRILDTDFAVETANVSRAQILQQAGTAMLAQANQSGLSVITLLR